MAVQPPSEPIRIPDSGRSQRLHIVTGACSIRGARRDTNEDSRYISPNRDLFIVADGMGGHAAGEVASKFAVDVLSHELAQIAVEADEREIENRVRIALDRAHCLILGAATTNPEYEGAGTTVVLASLVNHRLYVAGVGDSRAYLIRGQSIDRLTIDDTWPDVLFHVGQISADDAKRHHMRNVLISALGLANFNSNHEEIRAIDVYDCDRFLLASDGLTDVVDQERILEIILDNDNPQTASEVLAREAVARDAGDDVTCVIFYAKGGSSQPAPSPNLWQRLTSLFKQKS